MSLRSVKKWVASCPNCSTKHQDLHCGNCGSDMRGLDYGWGDGASGFWWRCNNKRCDTNYSEFTCQCGALIGGNAVKYRPNAMQGCISMLFTFIVVLYTIGIVGYLGYALYNGNLGLTYDTLKSYGAFIAVYVCYFLLNHLYSMRLVRGEAARKSEVVKVRY